VLRAAPLSASRCCAILRDIFGPPRAPRLDPAWLAWGDRAVVALAGAVYRERAFDQLPILADALTDAGCDDEVILAHLRGRGLHTRGCWVVDRLLNRE
jgi:hypothetical protein